VRYRFPFLSIALALVTVSCSTSLAPPAESRHGNAGPDPVAQLRRPWRVERHQPGTRCPVTTKATRPDKALGPVQGGWLVGPIGLVDGRLDYAAPDPGGLWADPTWAGQKVAWAVNPALTTPVLIRGRQLDGPGDVRFDDPAVEELLLDPTNDALPGGWRDYPSFTRLRTPGCYAYQIDAAVGSFTIVFRAFGPVVASTHS
jgi:hypothetical protein